MRRAAPAGIGGTALGTSVDCAAFTAESFAWHSAHDDKCSACSELGERAASHSASVGRCVIARLPSSAPAPPR